MRKHYILTGTQSMHIDDITDMASGDDNNWLNKSRRLQARRWRKIRGSED